MTFLDNIEQIVTTWPLLAFGAVFLAGVVSSASPCVLVTIPLVVGFVGGYSDGDRWKAFRYSVVLSSPWQAAGSYGKGFNSNL